MLRNIVINSKLIGKVAFSSLGSVYIFLAVISNRSAK